MRPSLPVTERETAGKGPDGVSKVVQICAYAGSVIWPPTEIKRRRELLGMTQSELAARVGASRRTVVDWENGKSKPQGRFYTRLVEVLDPSDTTAPPPSDGLLLKDAGFVDVVNRLVELYQEAERGSILGLRIEDGSLPANFDEAHHVTRGPQIESADQDEGNKEDAEQG
jgi:DNA-binding XRE family transcriptional regulator